MTNLELEKLQDRLVLLVSRDFSSFRGVRELMGLPFREEFNLDLVGVIYDPVYDRYSGLREIRATLTLYVDKNLGCFSDDERVEMVSARVKHVCVSYPAQYSVVMVGMRVDICFDSLQNLGCIRSAYRDGRRTNFALSGYLRGYDFDGDPVEPLPGITLSEALGSLNSGYEESEEPEGSGGGNNPEQEQPGKQPEEQEQPEEYVEEAGGSGNNDGYDAGMFSQAEIEQLLNGMAGDEPNSEGGNGGSEEESEGSGAGDSKTEPEAKPVGGKRHFGSRS